MFYLNVGYHWDVLREVKDAIRGAIFCASTIDMVAVLRRECALPNKVLFDPQMYLLDYELEPETHLSLVRRLCTYNFFGITRPEFNSSEQNQSEYKQGLSENLNEIWKNKSPHDRIWGDLVEAAIAFQKLFGVSSYILPSILIRDPEDNLDRFFNRLDEASQHIPDDKPTYISVALSEAAMAHKPASENELLASLADELTARPEIKHVYIVLASESSNSIRHLNPNAIGGFLALTKLLSENKIDVLVNFAESLGIAALGFGAGGYGASYYNKGRALRLSDFVETKGRGAYPNFHSTHLAVDFEAENDLVKVRDCHLLKCLKDSWTPASKNLKKALEAGQSPAVIPGWARTKNNTKLARMQFAHGHSKMGDRKWTPSDVLDWLQNAEMITDYIDKKTSNNPMSYKFKTAHLKVWRKSVEDLVNL